MSDVASPGTRCRACGDRGPKQEWVAREMTYGTRETFPYDQCAACDTLQIRVIPDDLAAHYPADYYSFEPPPRPPSKRARWLVRARDRAAVFGGGLLDRWAAGKLPPHRVLEPLRSLGLRGTERILDVGSGGGAYLRDLADLGFPDVLGVDPHLPRDVIHDNGARVLARPLADVTGTFDLITLHHAFEHVAEPLETLQQVAERLTAGGRCLVRIPTVSSEAFERFGVDWVQLDAPRHLHLFSRQAMELMAHACGLRVERVSDDSTAFQFWGSEQLRHDVAVLDETSFAVDPERSRFTSADIERWETEAAVLNAAGRGDQACFFLCR